TLVEGNIPVKALIDTTSKSNTISKSLFDKLELIGEEIKGLGLDWLWMRKAEISFEYPPKIYTRRARIVIDDMGIPLIEENNRPTGDSSSHNASPTKNDPP
ncbi:3726_t:CDS:2, partial [Paraglomus brasilianum]